MEHVPTEIVIDRLSCIATSLWDVIDRYKWYVSPDNAYPNDKQEYYRLMLNNIPNEIEKLAGPELAPFLDWAVSRHPDWYNETKGGVQRLWDISSLEIDSLVEDAFRLEDEYNDTSVKEKFCANIATFIVLAEEFTDLLAKYARSIGDHQSRGDVDGKAPKASKESISRNETRLRDLLSEPMLERDRQDRRCIMIMAAQGMKPRRHQYRRGLAKWLFREDDAMTKLKSHEDRLTTITTDPVPDDWQKLRDSDAGIEIVRLTEQLKFLRPT